MMNFDCRAFAVAFAVALASLPVTARAEANSVADTELAQAGGTQQGGAQPALPLQGAGPLPGLGPLQSAGPLYGVRPVLGANPVAGGGPRGMADERLTQGPTK
ncbi:MAG: hypothetical protein ACHQK9_04315 [Reyranellales bacterium]